MKEIVKTTFIDNGKRIDKLRALKCKTLADKISVDATITELELDTKGMLYQHYSNPTEEDIKSKLDSENEMNAIFGDADITEDDIRAEYAQDAEKTMKDIRRLLAQRAYFASLMSDFPDVKIIDLETIDYY